MSKDINSEVFDETTLTKLDIYEGYLEAWLPVFVLTPHYGKSAAIWDFFAGSGQDAKKAPGSPLRILKQINAYKDRIVEQNMSIRVVLNEGMKRKAASLHNLIEGMRPGWTAGGRVRVECRNEDFQALFPRMIPQMRQQPNLVFLDQYGVKEVNDEVFRRLIEIPRTDFLFFISSSAIKRFAATPEFSMIFPDISPEKVDSVKMTDAHRMVLEYYRRMIPAGNSTRLYPFSLRRRSNIYGLIFGSGHPLGAEKFLDLAWETNQLNGEANFDINDDIGNAIKGLFVECNRPTKRECFENDLERFIRGAKETDNRAVYEFTMQQGHPKAHARECVLRLRKEKKIDFKGRIGFSYKSCFGKSPRIVAIKAAKHG